MIGFFKSLFISTLNVLGFIGFMIFSGFSWFFMAMIWFSIYGVFHFMNMEMPPEFGILCVIGAFVGAVVDIRIHKVAFFGNYTKPLYNPEYKNS